jgi:hypothetical protein
MERKEIWMVHRSIWGWIDMLDVIFHRAPTVFLRVTFVGHRFVAYQ